MTNNKSSTRASQGNQVPAGTAKRGALKEMFDEATPELLSLSPPINSVINPTRLGYKTEIDMWNDLYTVKRKTVSQLAALFKVSHTTVRFRLARAGVRMRSRGGPNRHALESYSRVETLLTEQGITPPDSNTLLQRFKTWAAASRALNVTAYNLRRCIAHLSKQGGANAQAQTHSQAAAEVLGEHVSSLKSQTGARRGAYKRPTSAGGRSTR